MTSGGAFRASVVGLKWSCMGVGKSSIGVQLIRMSLDFSPLFPAFLPAFLYTMICKAIPCMLLPFTGTPGDAPPVPVGQRNVQLVCSCTCVA